MSWLETHIEEFVEPVIGESNARTLEPLNYFFPEELSVIKNTWRSVKKAAEGKPICLPGRDVFVFEVLAQREKYPTLFVPECSRLTVDHIKIENLEEYFLFDTGFAGSIPRGLGVKEFKMMSHAHNFINQKSSVQVFPHLTFSRGLALKIERTPKYWQTGRIDEVGEVKQDLSSQHQFGQAARLTVEVYKNSAPKFIKKHKPMSIRG